MLFSLRFRVKIEYIKPEKLDAGTTIKGLDYIDVPGLTTRDYKLTFHSHKECQPLIKVGYYLVSYQSTCMLLSSLCQGMLLRLAAASSFIC